MWSRDVEPPSSPPKEEASFVDDFENSPPHQITTNKTKMACDTNNENVSPNQIKGLITHPTNNENLLANQNQKTRDSASPSRRCKKRTTFSPDQRNLAKQMFKDLMSQSVESHIPNCRSAVLETALETEKSSVSQNPQSSVVLGSSKALNPHGNALHIWTWKSPLYRLLCNWIHIYSIRKVGLDKQPPFSGSNQKNSTPVAPGTSQTEPKKDGPLSSSPAKESGIINDEEVDTKSLPIEAQESDKESHELSSITTGTEDGAEGASLTTKAVEDDVDQKETAGLQLIGYSTIEPANLPG